MLCGQDAAHTQRPPAGGGARSRDGVGATDEAVRGTLHHVGGIGLGTVAPARLSYIEGGSL